MFVFFDAFKYLYVTRNKNIFSGGGVFFFFDDNEIKKGERERKVTKNLILRDSGLKSNLPCK